MSDTMLTGVLRAPAEPTDLIAMVQLIDRAKQAADEIELLRQRVNDCEGAIGRREKMLAQAQADVARLREGFAEALSFADDHPGMPPTGHLHKLFEESRDTADAFIKLKQAEALDRVADNAVKPMTEADLRKVANLYREDAVSAQRLRGEVDDA